MMRASNLGRFTSATVTLILVLGAGACAMRQPQETVVIDTTVSEADLRPYRTTGPASVSGQAFMRQKGGGVVTCAGSQVLLVPDLPPIRRAVAAASQGKNVEQKGPKWDRVARGATCDAQGNFRFDDLPLEAWYVVTEVAWEVADYRQGGFLGKAIRTSGPEEMKVLLTDDDFISRW